MNRLGCMLAISLVAAAAPAQTWTYPLNPRATFLRTNNDSPVAPLILDLASLGVMPGSWLRIGTTGAFRHINGGADNYRNLIAVFSSNNQLLATSVQNRVPGAIAAGAAFASGATYYGSLPMDIAQDFFCSRDQWDANIAVRVPAGATHLFLGVHDSLYNDNVDPNGDFAAVVSVEPTPSLPGTSEHLELRGAVGSTPVSSPDVHATTPGAPMLAELRYPIGFADGSLYVLVGDTVATGSMPLQLLPNLWTPNLIVVQVGILPSTPGWTAPWQLSTPGGLTGTTLVIQAGALVPTARNGLYVTSNAHRYVL
jgi:hypothetical protein